MTLILVAGDYGKTTTAIFLKGILTEAGRKTALIPARYRQSVSGFYTGMARAKKQGYEVAIIEVDGTLLDSGALTDSRVDCLVVTSDVGRLGELLKLNPQHLVVPSDLEIPAGSVEPYQHITVGEEIAADARVESMKLYRRGTELRMVIDHQTKLEVATQLVGRMNAKDLAVAIAAAYVLGVELSVMQEGVADITPVEGRFERIETSKKNDCYVDAGGSLEALQDAINSAKQLAKRRCIVVVHDNTLTREMIDIAKEGSDRLFVADFSGVTPAGVEVVSDGKTAVEKALRAAQQDDLVLLYGRLFVAEKENTITVKEYLKENEERASSSKETDS